MNQFNDIIAKYKQTKGINQLNITTALIDMDGVLYDSMKYHTIAWKKLTDELNIEASLDEFYIYEGMTGAGIIRLLFKRSFNEDVSDEKAAELYAIKAKYFGEVGKVEVMPDAQRMTSILRDNNIERVLVTGSGQASILNCLDTDYAGIFDHDKRVTAHDVTNCKPHPEPYLRGMEKAGRTAEECIVIENAPLGIKAGKAAGCFVIGITTGPIPKEEMVKAGADLVFGSMGEFADALPTLIEAFRN